MSHENADKIDPEQTADGSDFDEYVRQEAIRLGLSEDEIRARENAARKEIKRLTLRKEQLRKIADGSVPPPKYLEGDEPCPF